MDYVLNRGSPTLILLTHSTDIRTYSPYISQIIETSANRNAMVQPRTALFSWQYLVARPVSRLRLLVLYAYCCAIGLKELGYEYTNLGFSDAERIHSTKSFASCCAFASILLHVNRQSISMEIVSFYFQEFESLYCSIDIYISIFGSWNQLKRSIKVSHSPPSEELHSPLLPAHLYAGNGF